MALKNTIKYTKDILIFKVSKKADVYSEEEKKQIQEISDKTSKEELINIIYKLSELENRMRWSSQKTILFETEIIKLCMNQDTQALEDRIEKLEKKLENVKENSLSKENKIQEKPKAMPRNEENVQEITIKTPENEEESVTNASEVKEKSKTETSEIVQKSTEKQAKNDSKISGWEKVLDNLKKQGKVILYANLINTEAVEENDMTIKIKFYSGLNSFRKELLQKSENMNILMKEIAIMCGKPMQIKFEDASDSQKKEEKKTVESKEENQEKNDLMDLDIPINIIEE